MRGSNIPSPHSENEIRGSEKVIDSRASSIIVKTVEGFFFLSVAICIMKLSFREHGNCMTKGEIAAEAELSLTSHNPI